MFNKRKTRCNNVYNVALPFLGETLILFPSPKPTQPTRLEGRGTLLIRPSGGGDDDEDDDEIAYSGNDDEAVDDEDDDDDEADDAGLLPHDLRCQRAGVVDHGTIVLDAMTHAPLGSWTVQVIRGNLCIRGKCGNTAHGSKCVLLLDGTVRYGEKVESMLRWLKESPCTTGTDHVASAKRVYDGFRG